MIVGRRSAMRIAIGCDEVGLPHKSTLIAALESEGHGVLDLGTFGPEPVDYPDYARAVGQAVQRGFVDAGVLVSRSGSGAAAAANKLRGIRAAFCPDLATARESREQDDANVLCLSARMDARSAVDVARAWLASGFTGDEVEARRVAKIAELEALTPAGDARAAEGPRERPVSAPASRAAAVGVSSAPAPVVAVPTASTAQQAIAAAETDAPSEPWHPAVEGSALGLPPVEETLRVLESQDFLDRLWIKDASLWRGEAGAIRDRLGWLTAPTVMRGHVDDLRAFADEIRRLQFSQVVVLGMGGSSLAPETLALTFGSRMGYPDLFVLDSTDPAAVKGTQDRVNLGRTLFVVSSKSGTTQETLSAYAYFRSRVDAEGPPAPGMHFVAITDPGSPLEALAAEGGFRRVFAGIPSIGGRFSALSPFGLVPAALTGADVRTLVERGHAMADVCGTSGTRGNPGVELGAALAGLGRAGRDKVTLVFSEEIRALGPWIEQLVAESLGKDGRGLVPVVDEPLGAAAVYGGDRVFVATTLPGDETHDAALEAIAGSGHPVIRLRLRDRFDLGGEFFRWELAVAAAGGVLGVNPFNEPDVAGAKQRTAALLDGWRRSRRLPGWPVDVEEDGIALSGLGGAKPASLAAGLSAHLAQAKPGDYVALLAYLPPTQEVVARLAALRLFLRDRLRVATTLGMGPRYLHSTGQLHKGGRPAGVFLVLTSEDAYDLPIPGEPYGFSTLKAAQALADLAALKDGGRRVARLALSGSPASALSQLLAALRAAVRRL
jgi:RpiB/LacA/LacB family sugar-phosphate isomerase